MSKLESGKIIKAVKWTSLQAVLDLFFKFSIRLFLAKLLVPRDFGLVGMCMVFIVLVSSISELGIVNALIQNKDDGEVEKKYSTAFWTGLVWGSFLFLIISIVGGSLGSHFYSEPKLKILIPFLSLGILFQPLTMIQTVILTRSLNFKKITKITNTSSLISGITAILMAYFDYGVWALVTNNLLTLFISIPFFLLSTKWKPKFEWNYRYFKDIFGFGMYSTSTNFFSAITYNIDNLMIGKLLGSSMLGLYTLPFSLTEQLRQIASGVMNKVMYPVFSKSQDDILKLNYYFLNVVKINALVIYPLMVFLFIFSDEIILNFFGQKWALSIIPLKILAIAVMFHLLINSFTSILRSLGKPKKEMKLILGLTIFILIPSLYFGITEFGLIGASLAILFNKMVLALLGFVTLKKEINLTASSVFISLKNIYASLTLALIVAISFNYFFTDLYVLSMILFTLTYSYSIYKFENMFISRIIKSI